MHKQIIIIILLQFALLSNAQYSYDVLIQTPADEKAVFVYHDKLNDEQIVIVIVECFSSDTNCVAECSIYTLTNSGDTLRWPFVDRWNDTLFSINNLIREDDGDYFMTGIGWTLDSIGRPKNAFDYNTKWNSNHEMIWENIHQRPAQFDGYSKSDNFKILKLINGNYLIGKTIFNLNPYIVQSYYFIEVDQNNGTVVKEKLMPFTGGYLQGLTYTIDSSEIILHSGDTYVRECMRNTLGAIMLDTTTYDTIRSYCYDHDVDPEKYKCVHNPYNAKISKTGKLILAGTGDCSNILEGTYEDYLFVYQYDSAFNIINRAFFTDKDTMFDAGWMESLDINENNEICMAGNHDREQVFFSSHYNWIYLAKVDENLNLISERYLGGDAEYIVYSMAATSDGGMVVAGTKYDYLVNDYEHDAFVIKTDGGLWVGQNEYTAIPVHSVLLYPNPGNSLMHIRTTEYPSIFELYDAQGKLLLSQQIEKHITPISVNPLLTGFYTWTLRKNNRIIDNGRWIKITP